MAITPTYQLSNNDLLIYNIESDSNGFDLVSKLSTNRKIDVDPQTNKFFSGSIVNRYMRINPDNTESALIDLQNCSIEHLNALTSGAIGSMTTAEKTFLLGNLQDLAESFALSGKNIERTFIPQSHYSSIVELFFDKFSLIRELIDLKKADVEKQLAADIEEKLKNYNSAGMKQLVRRLYDGSVRTRQQVAQWIKDYQVETGVSTDGNAVKGTPAKGFIIALNMASLGENAGVVGKKSGLAVVDTLQEMERQGKLSILNDNSFQESQVIEMSSHRKYSQISLQMVTENKQSYVQGYGQIGKALVWAGENWRAKLCWGASHSPI